MSFQSVLLNFKFFKMERNSKRPDSYCPNSWGREYYNNVRVTAIVDEQIDINNHKKERTFIRKFVSKNIIGARLGKHHPYQK